MPDYSLDASRCVLIVQDMQNDVIIDGGAFAESGAPQHAKDQNVVENVKDLAAFCRGKGIPVIHVWYIVDEGAPGLKVNAPLFEGVAAGALVLLYCSWGFVSPPLMRVLFPLKMPPEQPAAAFAERLAAALAAETPLTSAERRARSGLTNRQVTLS